MNGEAHANQVGQEEATKVGRITCARAFPADRVWTHCAGVQHIVCRNEDGQINLNKKKTILKINKKYY
jgi:hypothetical protein